MFTQKMKKIMLTGMAVLAMGALVAGCGSDSNSGQAVNGKQVIKVGTNATFVPFEFKDESSQDLTGFDIDMVKAIAKKMNADVQFKNVAFDALIPSLGNKDIDMAASGMTITKARSEKVLFTAPYYESGIAVVVKGNSPINTLEDLQGKPVLI